MIQIERGKAYLMEVPQSLTHTQVRDIQDAFERTTGARVAVLDGGARIVGEVTDPTPPGGRPLRVGDYVRVKRGSALLRHVLPNEIVQIVNTGLTYDWHIRIANGSRFLVDSKELEFVAEGTVAQ